MLAPPGLPALIARQLLHQTVFVLYQVWLLVAATVMVRRYLDVFANNALRRSTSTYYNLFPNDINMLFILVGLDIAEFCCCCCCFRCCLLLVFFVIVSFLHFLLFFFCIFLNQQCAFISLSVICAIQIISATPAGTCTSESKNINGQQLDVTSKTKMERVHGTWLCKCFLVECLSQTSTNNVSDYAWKF